jgi:hypothetical protein
MHTAKDFINYRARSIARHAGLDPVHAVKSMRAISCVGDILVAADGVAFATPITDNNGTAVAGDHWLLQGQGSQNWVLVAMVSNSLPGTEQVWGYKDFIYNDNPINRVSFQSSLADRSSNAGFFSLEALRAGLDPFPWEDLPSFGPNDTLRIAAYNASSDPADSSVQFWILPVFSGYKAPKQSSHDCVPCKQPGHASTLTARPAPVYDPVD